MKKTMDVSRFVKALSEIYSARYDGVRIKLTLGGMNNANERKGSCDCGDCSRVSASA